MNFSPIIIAEVTAAASQDSTSPIISMLVTMVPVLVIFYFFIVRPQKKREKEDKEMRENIQIGDEIITIGGIIGLVVRQTDDTLVIETGGDKSKIRIQKSAVRENVTAIERKKSAVSAEDTAEIKDKKSEK